MKKKILILYFLTVSFTSFCQLTSGEVIYKIKTIDFDNKVNNPKGDEMIDVLKKIGSSQTFVLKFNKSSSKFIKIESLKEQDNKDKLLDKIASLRFTVDFNFYVDFKLNFTIKEKNDGTLIKEMLKKNNWQITNETKKIDEYTCYKAEYTYQYTGRDNKPKTRTITAWFAPSLPFSYGPKNYNGLPGLILELQDWNTTFLATKIELFDKEIKIDFPKGKTITQEEYERKVLSGN